MLLSTITAGTLPARIATRRANGRADGTNDDADQGEVVEAARPGGKALRDPRLLLRAAARAAPEREAWSRRRGHSQEASAAADADPRAERRQARHTGAPGALAGARGSRPPGAGAKIRSPAAAPGARRSGRAARGAAGEARRERAAAVGASRVLPLREGSDEGAVLGRRGAGADRRGGDRNRRPDGRHGRRNPARARENAGDAGARRRDRRVDRFGRARGLHLRPDSSRPRACADGLPVAGRSGARADEEGGRDRSRPEGARELALSLRSCAPRVRLTAIGSRRGERGKPRVSRASAFTSVALVGRAQSGALNSPNQRDRSCSIGSSFSSFAFNSSSSALSRSFSPFGTNGQKAPRLK